MLGQRLADAVLDGAEVLADDERLRPVALQRDDVEQVLGRVADVGAVGGRCRPTAPTTAGTGPSRGRSRRPPAPAMVARIDWMNGS